MQLRILLYSIIALLMSSSHATGQIIELPREARFRFGDNPEWAIADFDDSSWEQIDVPQSWQASVDPWLSQHYGWYRIRVDIPQDLDRSELAMCVGVVSDACEVYVNGLLVATQGKMAPSFDGVPTDPLVLDLPRKIAGTREILVAIRVHRFIYGGGITHGPMLIGSGTEVYRNLGEQAHRRWFLEGAVISFVAIPFIFGAFLWASGAGREYALLAICGGATLLCLVLDSRLFIDLVGYSTTRHHIYVWNVCFLPLLFHVFVGRLFACRVRRIWSAPAFLLVAVASAMISFRAWDFIAIWLWYAVFLCLGTCWVAWAIIARRSRQPDSTLLMAGIVALVVLFNADLLELFGENRILGVWISSIGVASFLVLGMVVMARRFARTRRQVQAATGAILTAHEDERPTPQCLPSAACCRVGGYASR